MPHLPPALAGCVLVRLHSIGDTLPSGKRATGKEPRDRAWQRQTESATVAEGENYGYLPGPSGRAVLDVEPAGLATFPRPTLYLTISTPSGGYHLPMMLDVAERAVGQPLRKKIKLGSKAELHTWGSQVLGPGSRAWSDKAQREGVYLCPDPALPLITDASEILAPFRAHLARGVVRVPSSHPGGSGTDWAHTAQLAELDAVAKAPEGTRNDELNRRSFRLGQIHTLDRDSTIEMLVAAATMAGLPEREARDTATRAFDAGRAYPRGPATLPDVPIELVDPAPPPPRAHAVPDVLDHVCRTVLTPGAHLDAADRYIEQSSSAFAAQVLDALPPGVLYRRDTVPGSIVGARFHPAGEATIRRLCDKPNVRLAKWIKTKDEGQRLVYETCSGPDAAVILDAGGHALPEVRLLTNYPVLMPDGSVSSPGYRDGVYYAGGPIEPELDPDAIRTHLLDLVVDFPFEDDASRDNFFGYLLTPILRPHIEGCVPMALVTSPKPGSGKGRLIGEVAGISLTGKITVTSPIPKRKEELSQWFFSLALTGKPLVHIDNLPEELDSGELASLVTTDTTGNRVLGVSGHGEAPNTMTVALSGNNVGLSDELLRRAIVIRLLPKEARPEDRTNWIHPRLARYCREQRPRTLACLLGAAVGWIKDEAEPGPVVMGSFEEHSRVISGILTRLGFTAYLANRASWRERGGTVRDDAILAFVRAWWDWAGERSVQAAEMMLHLRNEIEAMIERPSPVTLGRILASLVDRIFTVAPAHQATVTHGWSSSRSRAYSLRIVNV